jgi:hypothetical protein
VRGFLIAADVIMGLILGVFLYAVVVKSWPALQHPVTTLLVLIAAVIVVLFRRPGGSLARRREGRPDA